MSNQNKAKYKVERIPTNTAFQITGPTTFTAFSALEKHTSWMPNYVGDIILHAWHSQQFIVENKKGFEH